MSGPTERPESDMPADQTLLESVAHRCYEEWATLTGAITDPDWGRLTVAQREVWRRVVCIAWGRPSGVDSNLNP